MASYCESCGACCATFRVSFYWAETDAHPDGTVPVALTQAISHYHVCMNGTEKNTVRCCALKGEVGKQVSCDIYMLRSSTCRAFEQGSVECNQARQRFGLLPCPPDITEQI